MCDWEHIETVPQAKETLAQLTQDYQVYIATSASDSAMEDVQKAFQRVGLDQYLSGYFCFANLGIAKISLIFILRSQNNWALSRANSPWLATYQKKTFTQQRTQG